MRKIRNYSLFICFVMLGLVTAYSQEELYEIERLNINLWHSSEFSPIYYNDGIVFCSNKKNDVVITYTDEKDRSLTDIYFAQLKEDFKFHKSQDFALELKSLHHDGPLTFSSDGIYVYFTRNYKTSRFIGNKIDPENKLGIFYAVKSEGVYGNVELMSFCNKEYNYMHPTVNKDNNRIYFASDQPGGYGGFDIYYSDFQRGSWSAPQNMGPVINTDKDEAFPFIHPSGRLYFASKGHPGMGRYDIYYTDEVDGKWLPVINLEPPFNSMFDDFALIINEEFETGYFSTARKRRQDDIYGFKSAFPSYDECPAVEENNYCFVFYEAGSMDLDTTSLKYEWDLGDGTKIRGLEAEHCFEEPGQYLIQLNVIDTITGDVYFSQASQLFTVEDIQQTYFAVPDTVYINEEIQLDGKSSFIKDFDIQAYYWNFGDGTRKSGIRATHSYRKPGVYIIQLGATDGGKEDEMQKACNSRQIVVIKR